MLQTPKTVYFFSSLFSHPSKESTRICSNRTAFDNYVNCLQLVVTRKLNFIFFKSLCIIDFILKGSFCCLKYKGNRFLTYLQDPVALLNSCSQFTSFSYGSLGINFFGQFFLTAKFSINRILQIKKDV